VTPAALGGITLTPGVYQINWGFVVSNAGVTSIFALNLGTALLPVADISNDFNISNASNVGGLHSSSTIVTITAGGNDTIRMMNRSGGTRTMAGPAGAATGGPGAYITIIQLQ
jgi:hypothetical protein